MSPSELIEHYQDACESVFRERPNVAYRYGFFYRVDPDGNVPIQRSTLERVVAAWGRS